MGVGVLDQSSRNTSTNVNNINLQDQQEEFIYGNNSRLQNADRDGFLSGDQNSINGGVSINYGDPELTSRLIDVLEDNAAEQPLQVSVGGSVGGGLDVSRTTERATTTGLPAWAIVAAFVLVVALMIWKS